MPNRWGRPAFPLWHDRRRQTVGRSPTADQTYSIIVNQASMAVEWQRTG
ncbi:hypothetical protein [Desmospora profundinema]|uniref:Uncharacterized protein n=1 Tax=Desmospora profundinema TaxID=1571184 RepID=A0ABU1IIQ3_9BACL|nr:hypothetical protein [Desmospora profundinema]MDR6224644.1 hypothetical protein [Desmospora profundinema]